MRCSGLLQVDLDQVYTIWYQMNVLGVDATTEPEGPCRGKSPGSVGTTVGGGCEKAPDNMEDIGLPEFAESSLYG